jgi:predicted dehydrogenase
VDAWRMARAKEKVESHYANEKASGTYAGCATFRDYRELLARSDIDAIFVGTPDHWHVPLSIAAMKAGKDVSCEKPLTLSIHEGRVLADVAKKLKRVTRTDSEFRSSKLFHHAVECVRNGRIGNLKKIYTGTPTENPKPVPACEEPVPADFDFEMWLGSAPRAPYCESHVHPRNDVMGRPGWMLNRDYCEGMICNWGAHLNDIAQFAHNSDRTGPVEVEATGTYPAEQGFRNVLTGFHAHYRYADGVTLDYKMDKPFIRLEGDEGWIEMPYGSPKLLASDPKIIAPPSGTNWKSFTRKQDKEDFIDCVLSREPTMEDFETGHRTISICQIAHIAIQLGGKKLKWDPANEKFDNEDANKLLKRPSWRAPWQMEET